MKLTPRETLCALLHVAGVPMKVGAGYVGVSFFGYQSYLREAVRKLDAFGGRIALERALTRYFDELRAQRATMRA